LILVVALLLSNITPILAEESTLNLQTIGVVLMEQESGKILYEQSAHRKMYPASTSKILTAMIALENGNPEDVITIGNEVLAVPLDASKAGHEPGDQITLKNLIAALLLPSGNDSAFAVASYVIEKTTGIEDISSEDANAKFAILMNQKAKELGANESNYINPHGYHDDNNYTTAYDLALITREALKIPLIKEIVAESDYTIEVEGQRAFEWNNRNLLLDPKNSDYYYQYATGVKTGYTEEAGECLVASATKNGVKLIAVLMNSPKDARWNEAKTLFDYGFDNYAIHAIVKTGEVVEKAPVEEATKKGPADLEAIATSDLSDVIKNEDVDKIQKTIAWNQTPFKAPITAGQIVGKVTYELNGQTIGEVELAAKTNIEEQTLVEFIFSMKAVPYWGGLFGGLVVVSILIQILTRRKNNNSRRHHYR
ncbi:MAG: D-alanyl-D-alanine carboxypeptidase, partial [Vallitaleaceae bacterium]|nr:D-alanyl-D-alanine carboxypeptidase [Vallitaleaceae bacterium]